MDHFLNLAVNVLAGRALVHLLLQHLAVFASPIEMEELVFAAVVVKSLPFVSAVVLVPCPFLLLLLLLPELLMPTPHSLVLMYPTLNHLLLLLALLPSLLWLTSSSRRLKAPLVLLLLVSIVFDHWSGTWALSSLPYLKTLRRVCNDDDVAV